MKSPKLGSPTMTERGKTLDRLSGMPSEQLAAFIVHLAEGDERVGRRIADLLARDNPEALAQRMQTRIEKAFSPGPHYGWHEAATFAAQLNEVLDAIEHDLLPANPRAAFDSLRDFIERDFTVMEMVDDSDGDIGSTFHRACQIFAAASKMVPSSEALPVWTRLMEGDQYGCRDELSRLAVGSLAPPEIAGLVENLREVMRTGGENAFGASGRLSALAAALHDPDLYAESVYRNHPRETVPAIALSVARLYLASNRPREALEHLPASPENCWSASGDWYDVRAGIAKALGDTEGERRTLWERFLAVPTAENLASILAVTPESEQPARRAAALEFVRRDSRDPIGALRFLVDVGETADAARMILAQTKNLNGDFYYSLVPIADALETGFPLAATAVYRALLDSILERKKTNTYPHGAAYWHKLDMLSRRVGTWTPLVPHEIYVATVHRLHDRKHAFWSNVQRHDPSAWAKERAARQASMDRMTSGDTEADGGPNDELF